MEISEIAYDTRNMKPNSVFVCIKGAKDDGHRFARQAVEKGASVIIAKKQIDVSVPVILTDDTERALSYLTKRFYGTPKLELIGITGTNGKTTTSYMLSEILALSGKKCGIIGTNGSFADGEKLDIKTTTPTTPKMPELYAILKEMEKRGTDTVVMEVSSHALSQNRIDGLGFEAGIFTNLSGDHLDYHKDMEDYFAAKKRLFDISKIAVVNADDEYGERILAKKETAVSFGIKNGMVRAENINLGAVGSEFDLVLGRNRYRQRIHLSGLFSIYNALSASATAYALGVSAEDILEGLSAVMGVEGRMERLTGNGKNVIIDYAHTPDGLQKVLASLEGIGGRLITVFGAGGDRDRTKRGLMGRIATEKSDLAIITSDNPRCENPTEIIIDILSGVRRDNYIATENREKAIELALSIANKGDTVLLAGKGQERYQIIGTEKIPFDEREIVKKYINR